MVSPEPRRNALHGASTFGTVNLLVSRKSGTELAL
jgi:hypothetical protein